MKELVETIAKALVDHPDDVYVTVRDEEQLITLELTVNGQDMGKVIGKQGRVAKAVRSVVNAAAAQQNKRVRLDIIDPVG
ncbi:KH domain-containing protein [Bacillus sp. FJAT-45350]|uniref:KH domain-containing protein n=1 Tax=Bacillus sp. FJAT-45350 TaxID=2011014 RepID=UPI000BB8239B|nr:KH domain-containing protein [Bacillus sp. FJAT-45350]